MNGHSCALVSNLSVDDMMGYISNPKVLSSWILGFWPCHANWGEVFSNALWSLHIWNSDDVSDSEHHLFACWLLSRRNSLTMLWILLLCAFINSSFSYCLSNVSLSFTNRDLDRFQPKMSPTISLSGMY